MRASPALWWLLGGAAVLYLYSQKDAVTSAVQSGVDDVTAAISGWANVGQGPVWVPIINAVEAQYGIPPNLLARMAYQESHFRPEFIDGTVSSHAGALGILQLMPRYFSTVQVARPFTPSDTNAQIQQAAQELNRLYAHYIDWGLALGAYNDGQGNMDAYVAGSRPLPAETVNYVSDILADVPIPNASIPA